MAKPYFVAKADRLLDELRSPLAEWLEARFTAEKEENPDAQLIVHASKHLDSGSTWANIDFTVEAGEVL